MFTNAHHLAEHFPNALMRMEQSRDVGELVGFFADGAVLSNLGAEHETRGADGARHFWQAYMDRFGEVHSHFTHLHMAERAVILEWCSIGKHNDGRPLSYRGISILAFDPQGKISEFRAFYDSAAFVTTLNSPTR